MKIKILISIVAATALMTVPAYAGEWKQDSVGWWWQNDDGSYPVNTWQWIDGNSDSISESYYFDGNGYILSNTTTPDGYTVDANGAWTIDGVVQTQVVQAEIVQPEISQSAAQTNERIVYWTANGKSYHYSQDCPTLSRSTNILSGPMSECNKTDPCNVCAGG